MAPLLIEHAGLEAAVALVAVVFVVATTVASGASVRTARAPEDVSG